MERISRILTLVAGLGLAGAVSASVPAAWAADRRPPDPTRLDPSYWPRSSEQGRPEQEEPARRGSQSHADYHADYHVKTGSEPDEPSAERRRGARERQRWPIPPDRFTRPPTWRR